MLGETEEYEPLSRAAYYHAMRKDQEKWILSPTLSKGEGAENGLKYKSIENKKPFQISKFWKGFKFKKILFFLQDLKK